MEVYRLKSGIIVSIETENTQKYPITVQFKEADQQEFCEKELILWKKGQLKSVKALYGRRS